MQENDAIHLFRKVFYNNVYHGLQSKCLFLNISMNTNPSMLKYDMI